MSVKDEIKSRLDIVSYIQQVAQLKKSGRNYKACCPFHSEKTPSFMVNPDTQTWRCFGACADGGDIFSFAMKLHGWTFAEAMQELAKQAGVEVTKQTPQDRQKVERLDKLRDVMKTAADLYYQQLMDSASEDAQKVRLYVAEKRGLTDETVRQFGIGYAPPGWTTMLDQLLQVGYPEADIIEVGLAIKNESGRVYDRFRNRLMIPIRDDRGKVIGFGARALAAEDNPKYLNSPQTPLFDKSRTLFGLDMARESIRDSETAVIVEGYMDVIQAHQAGFKNVVAQMGTAMTETQIKKLVPRYANKIIMALDADAAGQSATRRSLETAREALQADYAGRLSVDIRILQIPGAKDPDDLIRETPDQWQNLIDHALPVADYVIEMEVASLPPEATIQERETAVKHLLPMLLASENDLYKQDNLQKLARRVHIGERDLLVWAREEQKRLQAASRSRPVVKKPSDTQPPSTSLSDEPPPLDYDSLVPPDEDEDDDLVFPSLPESVRAAPKSLPTTHSLEANCLRRLLENAEGYYHVNRYLRELAGNNVALLKGPLADFSEADFIHDHFGDFMRLFMRAVEQHELDLIDYIRKNLDETLRPEFEALLSAEEVEVHQRVMDRHKGDFAAVWKQYERGTKLLVKPMNTLLDQVMRLRTEHLKRELDDLRFMQMDAQTENDYARSIEFTMQINYVKLARELIDRALNQLQQV